MTNPTKDSRTTISMKKVLLVLGVAALAAIFITAITGTWPFDDDNVVQANDNDGETPTAEASVFDEDNSLEAIVKGVIDAKFGEDDLDIVSQDDLDEAMASLLTEINVKLAEIGENLLREDDLLKIITEMNDQKFTQAMVNDDTAAIAVETDSASASNGGTAGSLNISALMQDWDPSDPPDDLNSMPKTVIELADEDTWFHRVFNERLFHAPDWGGADSWFVSLNLGPQSGGFWTDFGNPGQIIYRGETTSLSWCIAVLTTSEYKSEFLAGEDDIPVAINVRITPHDDVTVISHSGAMTRQATSDGGDITIILPDDGVTIICTAYTTAAPTHESHLWWGPYDRSEFINTIDAR